MTKRFLILLILGVVLSTFGASTAQAWPDSPPDKAFLSGPGIEGQVRIRDPKVLGVLRLGGLEDMKWGAIAKPKVTGEGYKIIRYFEGGEFRMGDLTYYPKAVGARSVVYFDDGAMLNGDRSPFHNKWLYTTAHGDTVMTEYLKRLNLVLADANSPSQGDSQKSATHDVLPREIRVGVPVTLGFTLKENHKIAQVILHRDGDAERIVLAANASGAPGHFLFNHTFPEAGIWNWSVGTFGMGEDVPLPPLTVVTSKQQQLQQIQPAAEGKTQDAPQLVDAATGPGVAPATAALAAVGAVIGIVGIGAVLVMQRPRR